MGIEPTTNSLENCDSTTELPPRKLMRMVGEAGLEPTTILL